MPIEHAIALGRQAPILAVRTVRDQQAARPQQSARISEQAGRALQRTDVDHIDVQHVVDFAGVRGEIAVRTGGTAVQVRTDGGRIAAPLGQWLLHVHEHCRADVVRGTVGRIGADAGQHAPVEFGRLERDVGEVRRHEGAVLAGAGGGVNGSQSDGGGAEELLQRLQNVR